MENDFKTSRRKRRLGEMECIKTAEDSLQRPVFAICNKPFRFWKNRGFLAC